MLFNIGRRLSFDWNKCLKSIWNGFPSSDKQSHSNGIYLKKYFANICNISTIELENCEEISKKSGLIVLLEKFNNFWRELGKLEIRR